MSSTPVKHPGFYVWNPLHGPASFRHTDIGAASTEAKRLAGSNPGTSFFVMAPVAVARSEKSPVSFGLVAAGTADPVALPFDLDNEIPF